jgi:lysophospholipase L1-like esterase
MFRIFTALLVVLIITYALQQYYRIRRLIKIGEDLVAATKPYRRTLASPKLRILVAGDSTGYGVGASTDTASLAGLVGAKYPEADIVNVSVSGARLAGLSAQLHLQPDRAFDLVLLHIGGNDVVYRTHYQDIKNRVTENLVLAQSKGKKVLLTSTGNVGAVRLLPWVSRWYFEIRSRRVRQIFKTAVANLNSSDVRYTDLFRERHVDPYVKNPDMHFASDQFHPSDTGYADWFALMDVELDVLLPKP